MAQRGAASMESKLQAENSGLRTQLTSVIGAARSVQEVLRRLWSQHEREQLEIQQLKAELYWSKAPSYEEEVPSGVRPTSATRTEAAARDGETWSEKPRSADGPKALEPECVTRVTRRAEGAMATKRVSEKTGAPSWEVRSWLTAENSSEKLADLLLAPLRARFTSQPGKNTSPREEPENADLELIRALAGEQDCKAAVLELLTHSDALPEIAGFIAEKVRP